MSNADTILDIPIPKYYSKLESVSNSLKDMTVIKNKYLDDFPIYKNFISDFFDTDFKKRTKKTALKKKHQP